MNRKLRMEMLTVPLDRRSLDTSARSEDEDGESGELGVDHVKCWLERVWMGWVDFRLNKCHRHLS